MPLAFLQLPRGCVEIREHVAGLKMERHGGSRRSRSSGDVRARACGQISRVNLCKGCGHKDARARKGGEVGLRVDYFEDPRPSNREHHSRTYLRDHKLEGPRGMSAGAFQMLQPRISNRTSARTESAVATWQRS